MNIDGPTMGKLCEMMAATIVVAKDDPNTWNLQARRIAERLGLNVTRIEFRPAIRDTCFAILQEASRQSRTEEDVRAALLAWKVAAEA